MVPLSLFLVRQSPVETEGFIKLKVTHSIIYQSLTCRVSFHVGLCRVRGSRESRPKKDRESVKIILERIVRP